MDTLRLMLLSLLVGATVSTGPVDADLAQQASQPVAQVQQQASQPEAVQSQPTQQVQAVESQVAQAQSQVQPSKAPVIYINVTAAPPTAQPNYSNASSSGGSTTQASTATAKRIDTGTSITRELYRGCQGDDVCMLQKLLKDLDYSVNVDGSFGTQTRNAVLAFQRNNGLKADGIAGTRTIRKLASSSAVPAGGNSSPRSTLSYGMRGQDVYDLQYRLAQLGYYYDLCSGNFLTNTRYAVRWFQMMNGLTADGIAGPQTQTVLYSTRAIPADGQGGGGQHYTRTLAYGMAGDDVTRLQTRLRDLGYYTDVISGKFLTNTRNAVRWFQEVNNLGVDGIAGPATIERVYSSNAKAAGSVPTPYFSRTLRVGMTGSDVTYLQTLLRDLGYFRGSTTTYFGTATESAVILFQQYNGLWADGVAGTTTQQTLTSGRAVPYDGGYNPVPNPVPNPNPDPDPWPPYYDYYPDGQPVENQTDAGSGNVYVDESSGVESPTTYIDDTTENGGI